MFKSVSPQTDPIRPISPQPDRVIDFTSDITNIYERFILKLETPVCEEKQVVNSIKSFIKRCGVGNKVQWFLNYGTNRRNSYDGFCILWLGGDFTSAHLVYRRLLNQDEIGMYRVKFCDHKAERAYLTEYDYIDTSNWADCTEAELNLYSKYKQFLVPLKPEVEPPHFYLSSSQMKSHHLLHRKAKFKINPIYLQDKKVGDEREPDVLFAQRVPPQIGLDFFNKNLQMICQNQYQITESNNTRGRSIMIKFYNHTDCLLFRTMFRKLIVPIGQSSGVIIFNYCFKKKRAPRNKSYRASK